MLYDLKLQCFRSLEDEVCDLLLPKLVTKALAMKGLLLMQHRSLSTGKEPEYLRHSQPLKESANSIVGVIGHAITSGK